MSKVGDLYYEILFKDGTDKGIKNIEDKIKELNAKLADGIDGGKLVKNIQDALSKQSFQIKVNASVLGLDNIGKQMEQMASSAATAMANAATSAQKTSKSTRSSSSKPAKDTFKSEWPQNQKFIQATKSSEENLRRMRGVAIGFNRLYAQYGNVGDKVMGAISVKGQRSFSSGMETLSRYGKMVDQISQKVHRSAVSNEAPLSKGFLDFARQAAERARMYQRSLDSNTTSSTWYRNTARSLAQKSVMSVTNIPRKGTEEYKAYQLEQQIKQANKRNDVREAVAAQNAENAARREKALLIGRAEANRAKILESNSAVNEKYDRQKLLSEQKKQYQDLAKGDREISRMADRAEKARNRISERNSAVNERFERQQNQQLLSEQKKKFNALAKNEQEITRMVDRAQNARGKIVSQNAAANEKYEKQQHQQLLSSQKKQFNELAKNEREISRMTERAEVARGRISSQNAAANERYERNKLVAEQRVQMKQLRMEESTRKKEESVQKKAEAAMQKRQAEARMSEIMNNPFDNRLRNKYVHSQGNPNDTKGVIADINKAISAQREKLKQFQKINGEWVRVGAVFKKGNKHITPLNDADKAEMKRIEGNITSLLHARAQMREIGKQTITVTDLPAKGSAAEKAELERRKMRLAESQSAYKRYFAEQDRLAKESAQKEKAAEKERLAQQKEADRQRLAQAKANAREMNALRNQGTTARAVYAQTMSAVGQMPKSDYKTYFNYAARMGDLRKNAIQSAWDIRGGRTPQYDSSQIAASAQKLNSWIQQYNTMRNAMNSFRGQIGNMMQTAANNPGRADAINKQIEAVRSYQFALGRAAVTYRQAIGGDTYAQSQLANGRFSTQWLQQVQKNAKAAGDAVRQATSGMQVNNYAQNLRQVADELANVQSRGSRVAEVLGGVFSVYAAKEFFDRLVQIGGEFEKQKLALASMFNSQTKADTLYSQIQSLAVKSPFTFGELTSYTKQMSAYGIQYKDIYDTTKRLADISAGVGVPMSRIILAYGQVSTAHFLRGQELRQFTEAGIPLVDALAKRFTKLKGEMVSADDVFTMISNRAVKFEDVKAVLDEMTDKGGRFYNMQDVLSESLSGKWSNLQDSIEIMYSEIENSNKGLLKGIVEAMTAIVRSWQTLMPIGAGLAAVFGALVVKQKIWSVLTTKASARDARMIADRNAMAEALARETEAYNTQTAAINSNSSSRERAALQRTGYRMVLNGADPNKVMANSNGIFAGSSKEATRLYNYQKLYTKLGEAQNAFNNAEKWTGKLSASVKVLGAQTRLAFAQMTVGAESFRAAIVGLFTWTNAIMLVLFGAISWWTSHQQKVDEMNEHVRESIKGMKDTYNELNEFIKANPIELTIAEDNATKINELYKSYKDKIENAPIDLSFVIQNAEQIPDVGDKLRYMRTELENLTFVTEQYQTIAAATTKAIADETDEFWFFGDSLGENLKDYMNSVRDYEAEKQKLNNEDYQDAYIDASNNMYRRLQSVDSATRNAITERWKQASVEIKKALDKGDIEEYLNLINRWNTQNPQNEAQFDPYVYTSVDRKRGSVLEDYDTMKDDIEKSLPIIENALRQGHEQIMKENGQIVEGESYTLKNLTDQGYQALLTLLQDYVNSGKWSKDEMEAYLTYIESKAKAAPGATWNTNTRMFHAFLDELKANYKKEFEGAEFTGQFSDSQNEAIKQAIHNLPIQFKPYEGQFLEYVKTMAQKAKGIIANALDMTNAPGSGAMTEAEEAFDKLSRKPGRNGDKWKKAYSIAAPYAGESYQDYIDRLSKSAVEYADKEYLYKNTKVRTASVEASQKQAASKKRQTIGVLWELNPVVAAATEAKFKGSKDKAKQDKARSKAESEANKTENERLKKLRDRMNRLQDIKNVYKKMAEIYGETDALARMKKSDLFAADGIPDSVKGTDSLNTWIASELGKVHDKAGTKTEEQRSVGESALKSKIDIEIEIDRKNFDREVKQLDRDIKKTKEQWSRYMAFREMGVSQEQSVMLTFGDGSKPTTETDYRRKQVNDILTKNNIKPTNVDEILKMDKDQLSDYFMGNSKIVDQLAPVVEAYRDAWNDVVKKNDDMYKSLLENAKTYNDKIADLNEKYMRNEEAIEAGRKEYVKSGGKSGLSPQMVERLRAANTQDYNKSVGEVQMERLQNSESYLNFFNAVTSMTIDEAMRIGEAIQNQLTAKLAAGTISAKDYADEIAKIQEQMDKVRNQKTLAQATLQGGLQGRVEWQKQNAKDRWNAANNAYGAARREYDEAALKGNTDAMGKASQKMWWLNIQRGKAGMDLEKAETREKRMKDWSDGISKFASAAEGLSSFRDTLGNVITSFGGDTDKAGFQTFSTVVDSISTMAKGTQDVMQKVMSGDFVGAGFAAITAPLNVITAFNKLHDQKLQRQIELSEKRSAEIKAASDQIQHAIENSLGTDAAKANAEDAYKQLSDQMYAAGKSQMGDSYKEIYKALKDSSNIRKSMAGLLESVNGTSGLSGKEYRNQEEYDALQKEGFGTTDTVSAYGAQYFALLEQRKELESRLDAENGKKNKSKDKISDYRDQLSDLNNQIREFKDTMLKDILGLDFKSWADNLASNLVGAFKKGQDAAEALASSVNDMMATITQNAIKNAVIMPYVNQLKEQIEDAYDINSPDSIDKVVDIIYGSEKTLVKIAEDAQKIWTETDRRTNGSLSKTSDSSSSSTIQGSSKGLTEETGGLIASYLNAIRADVSFNRTMMEKLMKESFPKVDLVMEAQLKELSTISKHTALIVQNTEANASAARAIKDTLGSVVTVGSGGKAIRIK